MIESHNALIQSIKAMIEPIKSLIESNQTLIETIWINTRITEIAKDVFLFKA